MIVDLFKKAKKLADQLGDLLKKLSHELDELCVYSSDINYNEEYYGFFSTFVDKNMVNKHLGGPIQIGNSIIESGIIIPESQNFPLMDPSLQSLLDEPPLAGSNTTSKSPKNLS